MFKLTKQSSSAKASATAFTIPKKEPTKAKSSIKIVAKKSALRTKTLIDAMQTLNIIPSFSTSNFGGDILPENVLIKNILDGMVASLNNLARILECLEDPQFVNLPSLKSMKPFLVKLNEAIQKLKAQSSKKAIFSIEPPEDYDADTEGQEELKNRGNRLRKKGARSSVGTSETEESSQEADAGKFVIGASRDLLLLIQNNQKEASTLARVLSKHSITGSDMRNFLQALNEMVEYANYTITMPYQAHMTEIDSLCGSIFMSQKLHKSIKKLQGNLSEVEASHQILKDEKSKEKLELVQAARNVRQMAKSLIDEMHEEVDTKIKTLAWNSHARQTRALEACARLKREFDEAIHHHTETETDMRHATIKLENEIFEMITEFDSAMFDKHQAIDKITKEYAVEKVELQEALKALAEIEEEKADIKEKQRKIEEAERAEKLLVIRRNVAAKVIQSAYRSYMARKMLKKKKKKKKQQ